VLAGILNEDRLYPILVLTTVDPLETSKLATEY